MGAQHPASQNLAGRLSALGREGMGASSLQFPAQTPRPQQPTSMLEQGPLHLKAGLVVRVLRVLLDLCFLED